MTIHIRQATVADFEAINAIVKQGQDEHAAALPHIFDKVDQVMPLDYYSSLIDDANNHVLVAVAGEQVVGFTFLQVMTAPPFDSMVPRRYAYMNDLGVDNAHQRLGIGRLLYQASLDWAKEQGATQFELTVWEFNQKAISFYESLGMHTISRKMSIDI